MVQNEIRYVIEDTFLSKKKNKTKQNKLLLIINY